MNINEEEDKKGDEGEGGQGGAIQFRDWTLPSTSKQREEALPAGEIKRLLIVQQELHKTRVDRQKQTRKDYKALKEGRPHAKSQHGVGHGVRTSPYKAHPISHKAQFSGIDRQVTGIPTENQAETNAEMRNELQNRNELRQQHQLQYSSTPKMRPF